MASCRRRFAVAAAVLAFGLVLQGCTNPPPSPLAGPDPADPAARGRPVEYRSTVAPYTSQRPVEPAPWGEQNQRVAPAPKQ
jgi:hypothetical protein